MMMVGAGLLIFGGLFWLLSQFISLGKLPGDISWQKGNVSFYFPLASSLLLSLILTLLLNLFGRR
ncbi:DUF2905 domain-containing protein [Heliobacterium chlorum]|uniref:DUF2905 domain-containing protein n=2 Tax=Heliobacterium chlorum TaxID=2698 RepID=A0ABR7T7J6_HELCL|nr:DUF2905 domain-containing protein [Heliobacterium chlorum]MBC9785666.1 DUF2905 domain-containing protein [Heliobacterium chlorum]